MRRRRPTLAEAHEEVVDLLVDFERVREAAVQEHGAWIYVSVDRETGELMNAAGFWRSEVDATLAAATDPDEQSHHRVVPLFVQHPYGVPT